MNTELVLEGPMSYSDEELEIIALDDINDLFGYIINEYDLRVEILYIEDN